MSEAVIIDCLRTAVGKAGRGALRNARPDDMAAQLFQELLARHPRILADEIDDVILGCAIPEGEAGNNLARIAALRAGLPVSVPGVTINRFCSSGLQAIAMAADAIRSGAAEIMLAGGTESMSLLPMTGHHLAPNPWLVEHLPETYISMGLTAENVQRKFGISREDQDAFAYRSHYNALAAQASGTFDDEIVPLEVASTAMENGRAASHSVHFQKDEGPRADTSLEALAKLKPVFHAAGTVTAGNSSQTSDGAAVAIVMSETKALNLA
jgi:acetyl-CoA acyltransferase